ncbi:hypothetical protein B0H67DRAFT_641154 [Lasiosphaeris hirsuta]|uniref:Uncharacterized protein n=1 Tax=Lasiosphaeris hirsuta TaxID=260670 RepID=A0AA40E5G3_9PEZI|nr:hypothetical protein B0H67DRAFT_641154 [Lasiosphaeris hirsuta]
MTTYKPTRGRRFPSLLWASASLVGKTKTIAFALGAPSDGMEVDYADPWSAWGGGWIDSALGSDMGGSVRFPARCYRAARRLAVSTSSRTRTTHRRTRSRSTPAVAKLTSGWYGGVYTNYAGTPEIVVPIGQVQYWSAYAQRLEWQLVTVALGVAKGCDLLLFELVDRLAAAGLLKETLPGVVAFAAYE